MIALVAGTRPEIVKLAPVYAAMKKRNMDPEWLFTGQSPDLAADAFGPFNMQPETEYTLTRPTGSLPELAAILAEEMRTYLAERQPSLVLCQGDTLSAAVAAQQSFLAGIKTGHVEAGLRSWNPYSPYPEEACRVWIDAVADYKFAPTPGAANTLSGEVWVTGNTVMDSLAMIRRTPPRKGRYAVVTFHRRENHAAVEEVCAAIRSLADKRVFDYVVWPVHPNPNVRNIVPSLMAGSRNVEIVQPIPYDQMVNLVANAQMLLTDSGGLQEEALGLGVPCLVMREETERPEGIAAGGARLVGTDGKKIVGWATWLMENRDDWEAMATAPNPYGDGKASERIALICKARMEGKQPSAKVVEWTPQNV
jgi:UDP-N-acetylglucosamine 2-epimerase (non-hydrolysing)